MILDYQTLSIIGGVLAFAAAWVWKIHLEAKKQEQRVTAIETKLEAHVTECTKQQKELRDDMREMQRTLNALRSEIAKVLGYLERDK
ncbi:hypothetical protein [Ferrovibrio sp.]|uniref:hypothetical protein n=1 Tax=Ferrovibrio sp. TaxID=1917215 RepID=UPI000CC8E325|nr:hypothetical protein [Ferrovibrio sp.]PJI40417.1 MAG: hypothetical protein CTR53_10425 [Ferrovibrio sp.]